MNTTFTSQFLDAYKADLAQKTRQGMEQTVRQGRPVSFVPLGYVLSWGEQGREVRLDPERAPLVRQAFEQVAAGKSIQEALKMLTALGLTSRNGKPLGKSSLRLVLRNPFYYGQMRYRGNMYTGNFQPLITEELFAAVQRQLARRAPANTRFGYPPLVSGAALSVGGVAGAAGDSVPLAGR